MATNYFAYGSNMASYRLLSRIPGAIQTDTAVLPQHRLRFRKSDNGESGKCDVEMTGNLADNVHGVVYQISRMEKEILDHYEGLGIGYSEKPIEITASSGRILSAFTYYAMIIDENLIPYHWYKEHVLRGAIEHGLPQSYIAAIRQTPSKMDLDYIRRERELAIYG
jgi:hypothetical protein